VTHEEAVQVACIVMHAHQDCSVCGEQLLEELQEAFPEFEWRQLAGVGPDDADH
jgi:hypothetical protein